MRESPIWKGEFGVLVCIESLQTLFDGFTRCMYNLWDIAYPIPSSSTYGVIIIGLPVIWSPPFHIDAKEKLNLEYLYIYPTILKNIANFLKPDWISNYVRQCSEWAIFFMYFPKYQVTI